MAYKAPSGLMGQPEEPERFVEFPLEDAGARYGTLFIDREVWAGLDPAESELIIRVLEYGRFRLHIERDAEAPPAGAATA